MSDNSLALFGQRDDIREMADRIAKLAPGSQKLSTTEALSVAQVAVAHGLDPFNGEVWGLKSGDKWYGVTVGIKGLRKHANRQAASEDTTYWTEFKRVQPEEYGAAKDAIVYLCILRDTVSMQAYGKTLNILTSAGVPYKEAIEMIGAAPQKTGIGIVKPGEQSRMDTHTLARKRAEAAAIRQRFDVSLVGVTAVEGDQIGDNGDAITAEAVEVLEPAEVTTASMMTPAERMARQGEILGQLGFGQE